MFAYIYVLMYVCVFEYVYVCIYVYIYMCVYVCMYLYLCVCMYIYVCVYVCLYVWIYVCMCIIGDNSFIPICMYFHFYIFNICVSVCPTFTTRLALIYTSRDNYALSIFRSVSYRMGRVGISLSSYFCNHVIWMLASPKMLFLCSIDTLGATMASAQNSIEWRYTTLGLSVLLSSSSSLSSFASSGVTSCSVIARWISVQ